MALPVKAVFRCGCGNLRLFSPIIYQKISVQSHQWYCNKTNQELDQKHHHPEKELRPPTGWRKFTIDKYALFVKWYEVKLEKKYPKAFSIYKLFKDGISEFFNGVKIYTSVSADIWTERELDTFTRQELEIYRQMPKDMLKVAPVLLISALPLANYVIFPIAYFFPRYLLSRQFWTPGQRLEFPLQDLKHRVDHYRNIFQAMKVNVKQITHPLHKRYMETIIEKLESNTHPDVKEILDSKPLFEYGPYQLDEIAITYSLIFFGQPVCLLVPPEDDQSQSTSTAKHMVFNWKKFRSAARVVKCSIPLWQHGTAMGSRRHLSRSMLMPYRRWKLWQESFLLHHIDKAMLREGVDKLTAVDLQQSCLTRGLNPVGLSEEDMVTFLSKWTEISSSLNEDNLSLLLHLPVMLTLHHPNNAILYKRR